MIKWKNYYLAKGRSRDHYNNCSALDMLFFWWLVGVDEATIIDIMTTRTNAQRQQIKAAYHKAKGKVKYIQTKLKFAPRISMLLLAQMAPIALVSYNQKSQSSAFRSLWKPCQNDNSLQFYCQCWAFENSSHSLEIKTDFKILTFHLSECPGDPLNHDLTGNAKISALPGRQPAGRKGEMEKGTWRHLSDYLSSEKN